MTGSEGMKHTQRMLASGTTIVGGVNPRRPARPVEFDGGVTVPVFGSVADAIAETGANVFGHLRAAAFAKSAVVEAIDAQIPLAVVITEGIRGQGHGRVLRLSVQEGHDPHRRPELPGPDQPRSLQRRHHPGQHLGAGRIGSVSKSGTLTYQMMYELRGVRLLHRVGIGGDPIIGTTHIDCLEAFEADPDTDAIVMIGEIGGDAEERAAAYIKEHVTKPVVGYVAGFTAPRARRWATRRHRVRLVRHRRAKKEALEAAGVKVGKTPSATADLMREIMKNLADKPAA
jgi:succinyl-CoA synthetase alpha subunit